MKIAITGANGHIGIRLIEAMLKENEILAVVRSAAARDSLLKSTPSLNVRLADYKDEQSLLKALDGADVVVHLVGIIKESKKSGYVDAHENPCTALVSVAHKIGIKHIVYLSIVGSNENAGNSCLRSKGRAEKILTSSGIETTVIRVPMVLGEGDFASYAIRKKAMSWVSLGFRSSSLEQPIYAGDLINAIQVILTMGCGYKSIQLAGPESLTRRALIQRAGRILDVSPIQLSLPLSIGMMLAFLCELLPRPPVTRAMLGVLDHDDNLDVSEICEQLSLSLTPLDEMLQKVLTSGSD